MRKRHWLKCLLGGWLSLVGGQALAQDPSFGPGGPGNPDAAAMMPPPYNTNYGTYPQVYQRGPSGYPPDANAWPNVSPYYGPGVNQTMQQDGFWFNKILAGNRKYYLTGEALIGHTGHPNSVIGASGVNNIPVFSPGVIYQDHNQQFFETPTGTSTIGTPDRETNASANGGGNNGGGAQGGDYSIFTTRDTSILSGNNGMMGSGGFRGTWGWWNPDQSGLQLSGFWQGQANSSAFIGDPRGFDPVLYTNIGGGAQTDLLTHLHAYAGIPLAGADTDHDGLPGVVQPFDIYYRIQFQTQTQGANLDWYASPIYERTAFMIRPIYGARYMRVREQFMFDGADSGLGYDISVPSSNTGGNNNNGGAAQTGQGFLSPSTLETTALLNVMHSALNSSVTSQLAGPEAGLRFDFGGDRLKVWTQSKFALLANTSSRQLSGYNIGDAYYPKTGGTATDPTVMSRGTPGPGGISPAYNPFAHSVDNTTILSPLFEQSIFAKANVFQFVPVLKKSKILSNAEFQIGYTAMFVGNMYRPSNTISWYAYNTANPSFPNGPQIADTRSTFFLSNLSLGVNWEY